MAAAAERNCEAAEEHYQIAMRQAEAFPQRLEQAEMNRFHAMMLIDRGASGDRKRAEIPLVKRSQPARRSGCLDTPRYPVHARLKHTLA